MADEHSNAAEKNPDAPQPAKEHSGSSKLVRVIIWGLVGLFAIIALMDIASREGFSKTLANLEEGIDKAEEPITLSDFESDIKSGLAIKTKGSKDGVPTILYKWPSLFRQYEIHLTVEPGDEQLLNTYSANDGPAALIGRPGTEVAGDDDGMMEEGGGPPGGGPPGGGPGMSGGAHGEGGPGEGRRRGGRRGEGAPGEGGPGEDRGQRPAGDEPGPSDAGNQDTEQTPEESNPPDKGE